MQQIIDCHYDEVYVKACLTTGGKHIVTCSFCVNKWDTFFIVNFKFVYLKCVTYNRENDIMHSLGDFDITATAQIMTMACDHNLCGCDVTRS